MSDYVFATDGMHYHVSQVAQDETGRWTPRDGAVFGNITRPSEFGVPPDVPEPAASYLAAWLTGQGAALGDKAGTYQTKVDMPAPAAAPPVTRPVEPPELDDVAETVTEPDDDADSARARRRGAR